MQKGSIARKSIKASIFIFGIIFAIALIGQVIIFSGDSEYEANNLFQEGTTISEVNVGGLSVAQAEQVVVGTLGQKIKDMRLTLVHGQQEWVFYGSDFKVGNNVKKVVQDAYDYQQKQLNNVEQMNIRAPHLKEGVEGTQTNLNVAFAFLFPSLTAKLEEVVGQIETPAINSQATFTPNNTQKFTYSKSQQGIKVNKTRLYSDLQNQFRQNHTDMIVFVSTQAIEPEINEVTLKDKTELVSIFSTDLHNSKQGRIHNVALSLSKINGLEVKPGQEVSFNDLTSPQTLEGGYEKSIIIFNGQFIEGVGGGICQASTTLYNALVLAGLEILEVNKHTLPVGYIELAFDSMVSENWADLRFKNNSKDSVYIAAYIKDERAYAEIYGKTLENGMKIKRKVEFVKTLPHPGDKVEYDTTGEYSSKVIYKGERLRLSYPREGYEAKGYLQYYSGGTLVKEEQIRHEIYEPQAGIVIEGAQTPPADYKIPESEVKLIEAQKMTSNTTGSNVSAVLLKNNPAQYNP